MIMDRFEKLDADNDGTVTLEASNAVLGLLALSRSLLRRSLPNI